MNTNELRQVIRSNFQKQVITLEKGVTCESFWNEFTRDCFCLPALETLGMDHRIRESLVSFGNVDGLELVNKQGRLMKRFAKHYKETNGEKLPDKVAGIIGDRLQYFVTNQAEINNVFYVDFTDAFDWEDGQFGKAGSCYWGQYKDSIPVLQDNGAFCIRFYSSMDDENGIGRTWVYPKDGLLMCFNSYGVERPSTSKVIKAVFNKHGVFLHYKAVEIFNSHSDTIPYINSGTGFVLYPEGMELQPSYDLDMEYEDEDLTTCEGCGNRFDMDHEGAVIDDYCYCDSCVQDRFSCCDKCGEYHENDDVHEIRGLRQYSYVCSSCADNLGVLMCEDCGEYSVDYSITEDTSEVFCDKCIGDHAYYCESCNEWNTEEHKHEEEAENEN